MLLRPRPGPLERELEDPIHSAAGKGALLDDDLIVGPVVDPAADRGILALVVLADDVKVDIARLQVPQRRLHPRHQAHRAQVRVLAKLPPDRDQQAPERNVVRHSGEAHRAEEDRVVRADLLKAIVRHHPAVLRVILAAPGEAVPTKLQAILCTGGFEHAQALGNHFLADSIARDHRDLVTLHLCIPHLCTVLFSMFRKIRFSTAKPIKITVNNPPNTLAVSNRFLFSKMYQPSPPDPWLTPNTNSAAISVRQANAQPIFKPVRMFGKAAGIRISATYRSPDSP